MARFEQETQQEKLAKIYGARGFSTRSADINEIKSNRKDARVEDPTPARIIRFLAAQSGDVDFLTDDSEPTEVEIREKADADLETRKDEVFAETGIENEGLLRKLAEMPADYYENFMTEWLELIENPQIDFDLLIITIDKDCVKADGSIRLVKLKRKMKEADQNMVK